MQYIPTTNVGWYVDRIPEIYALSGFFLSKLFTSEGFGSKDKSIFGFTMMV